MYRHHEESLHIAIAYFKNESRVKDSLIAIIFGGSVAKGCESLSQMKCMTSSKRRA